MNGSMPPGDPGTDDVTMTNAGNGAGNIFDTMLAEIDADWGNVDAQDVFMYGDEMDQDTILDPALFGSPFSPLTDDQTGTAQVPGSANYQDEQQMDAIFGIAMSPPPRAESAGAGALATPRRERSTAGLLSSSPPTSSTPTRSPRGHYGSARRRRAVPTNFQPIVPSPRGQAVQSSTNEGGLFEPFEAIPEHQQGILGPEYFNENIPEFRPRDVEMESSRTNYNRFNVAGGLGSSFLATDTDAVNGNGVGGYGSQGTESGTALARMQDALQYANQIPAVSVNAYRSTDQNAFSYYTPTPAPAPAPAPALANTYEATDPNALRYSNNYASVVAANPYVASNPVVPANSTIPSNTLPPANAVVSANTFVPANSVVQADYIIPSNAPLPANSVVPANANANPVPNAVQPWAAGLTFQEEPDPERRAKMLEVARVSHMLLDTQQTLFNAQKAKVIQAARAADEALKKPTKRRTNRTKKDNKGQDNAAKKTQDPAPPAPTAPTAPTQSSGKKSGPAAQGNARSKNASNTTFTTTEQHIAQFWRGRRDQSGHSFLCHGSMARFLPGHRLWNTEAAESRSKKYGDELPDEHPKLSEDGPEQPPPHSRMMLYTEVMTEGNVERPVHSGQIMIISYDIKSEWWKKINIWTWQRYPVARCIDEIAVVITPFHIVFGRIPLDKDIAILRRDWEELIGLIDRLFMIPVVGSRPTWAVMYRLLPCFAVNGVEAVNHEPMMNPARVDLLKNMGSQMVYHTRFQQKIYYVPPVGDLRTAHTFSIRVGHFGQQGHHDRPHLEIIDTTGRRVFHD